MPSIALQNWSSIRVLTLDELGMAHQAIGGAGRGRRYATQQINYAYAVLLASQFQGFCRDLHTECADAIVRASPPALRVVVDKSLLRDRRLDKGNPNPANIGADFGRFDISFWSVIYRRSPRNEPRRRLLEELNDWRNAIAHQDFTHMSATAIQLQQVQRYRAACTALAHEFDDAMYQHLSSLLGGAPW